MFCFFLPCVSWSLYFCTHLTCEEAAVFCRAHGQPARITWPGSPASASWGGCLSLYFCPFWNVESNWCLRRLTDWLYACHLCAWPYKVFECRLFEKVNWTGNKLCFNLLIEELCLLQVAAMSAEAKQQRGVLDKRVTQIANYGIPVWVAVS